MTITIYAIFHRQEVFRYQILYEVRINIYYEARKISSLHIRVERRKYLFGLESSAIVQLL